MRQSLNQLNAPKLSVELKVATIEHHALKLIWVGLLSIQWHESPIQERICQELSIMGWISTGKKSSIQFPAMNATCMIWGHVVIFELLLFPVMLGTMIVMVTGVAIYI